MDQLRPESLDWALTHIQKFGDTDIFPIPFEFQAIKQDWNRLRGALAEIDLGSYEARPLRRFLIPKPLGGYRVAIQLDPLDSIIYTALVYEAADLIERQRMPLAKKIACSYRVQIDPNGQLFRPTTGWDDFHAKSQDLAECGEFNYVVVADIADFYNQISHHRVKNALEIAGVLSSRAENIEHYLMNLTGGQSRGIPVGPSGSILLAEACLSDVDTFLLRKSYSHTRYVDDFRIFCHTHTEALQALHDLSEYLYTSHRLAVQSHKSRPMTIAKFIARELLDPEKLEEKSKMTKINEALQALSQVEEFGWLGYSWFEDDEPPSEDQLLQMEDEIARSTISELFDSCLSADALPQGLARYLLRRATQLRTNVIQNQVLDNLEKLAPVMRDVSKYLLGALQAKSAQKVGKALIEFITNSDYAFIPFVRLWVLHILVTKLASEFDSDIHNLCQLSRDQLGIWPSALLARELKYLDWIRAQKEIWQNNNPWDRRAIIWAAAALPEDERRFWLKRVENAGDLLDRAVAIAVRNGL